MRYTIQKVHTFIEDKNLKVSFEIDTNTNINIPFADIKKVIPSISVFEIEILEGCQLESKQPNSLTISLGGTIDDLREKNKSKILSFQQIYSAVVSNKNSKHKYVKICTTDNKVYFSDLFSFACLVGILPDQYQILKGAFISPQFFKKGDVSDFNGRFTVISEDDKIVASFNIRIKGSLDYNHNLYKNLEMKDFCNDDFDPGDRPSYEKYNGYNGFDDQTIDDAFEGDPEATWNVD